MFTNLIAKIHNCLREEDILQAGVESVKQALGCDRVVVYSLQPQTMGKILAEAVAVEYPRSLQTTIDDPCFGARYIDSYREGRISAIENIHEAKITPCHLENLDRLAVKANLVLPLRLPDDDLFGLLILHQCSAPRTWAQTEITLAAQMASQIGWALDNAIRRVEDRKAQLSLDKHHHYQDLLTIATQKIHSGSTRLEVLQLATEQVQTMLECDRSLVYVVVGENLGKIVAEAILPALSPLRDLTIELPYLERRHLDEYQQGRVRAIDNIYEAEMSQEAIESLAQIAVKASIVVPIIRDLDDFCGLLVAHQCFNYRQWQEVEIEWLRQIGIQTGLALTKAQLQEEIATMKSSLRRASMVKQTIANADYKIQEVKQSLAESAQTSGETKHLMRLLGQEVVSLTNKVSSEDINLARIITKKLQANTETATAVATSIQDKIEELSTEIDSGIRVYKSRIPS